MLEQIWEARDNFSIYHDLSYHEFSQIKMHVDIGRPKVVLELGCGLGRGSIFLNHLLKDDSVQYILADRHGRTKNTGAYNPKNDEYYNDLSLTEDFCRINGIKNIKTFDTEQDDWESIPKADFIFSLCSFGMHVSIHRYIDRIISASNPDSTAVFGVRGNDYGRHSFADRYGVTQFHRGVVVNKFPQEDWLILKNPGDVPEKYSNPSIKFAKVVGNPTIKI